VRIVIDMQGAQTESRFRGIGRYTMSFAKSICRNRGEHEVILAVSGLFPETIGSIRAEFNDLLPQENIRVWYAPGPVLEAQPGNQSRRKVAEVIREAFITSFEPDIVHISSLFEGYGDDAVTSIGLFAHHVPVSVSLYDLIPLLNPDHYLKPNPSYADYYYGKVQHLKRASLLLAISDCSRQEVLDNIGFDSEKVVNISTAVDDFFRQVDVRAVDVSKLNEKFKLDRPFVLYTGGSDNRKNLRRLIEAYAALPYSLRLEHQLLFAGKMSDENIHELIANASKCGLDRDELVFTGYVSDEELVQLFNLCKLFVFPSWHEGFGLPALEAMACGAPVISASNSSLQEVIGLHEAMFDPFDVQAISAKMVEGLTDTDFRARLCANGVKQASKFSWDLTGKKAFSAWQKFLDSGAGKFQAVVPLKKKPKLAFVSPLPPERTGIADYSAELLPVLSVFYDIEVIVAQSKVDDVWISQHVGIRNVEWFRAHAAEFDRVLYHIGNSPYHRHMLPLMEEIPGTVVLHDFYMSGLLSWLELNGGGADVWALSLYESHGYHSVQQCYKDPEETKRIYPANWKILRNANGVIVHSDYSRQLACQFYGSKVSIDWQVLPLLRKPVTKVNKKSARRQLDIGPEDFVVCSFGFLDYSKNNHRLLNAWLKSALAGDKCCKLIFVGENHGGDYGISIQQIIRESSSESSVHITGFADPETFKNYLAAADLAVQLRTNSRGETSAAVLDCMNHGLPVIVNANGSMGELDPKAVWMLPDEFGDGELIGALEILWRDPRKRHTLGSHARQIIQDIHSPKECARLYAEAIEFFYRQNKKAIKPLVRNLVKQGAATFSHSEQLCLATDIAKTLPLQSAAKRLFLDVTATSRHDLKTGIERVARALIVALLNSPPDGYRIEPVYLTKEGGAWHHRYARSYTFGLMGCVSLAWKDEPIDIENGDVILGLDISGDALIQAERSGLIENYRNLGVSVYYMVYDLLPIRMPQVFPDGADDAHSLWLRAVSAGDGAVCISKTVAEDLARWQQEAGIKQRKQKRFRITWSHLGADVANSSPSTGLPENAKVVLELLSVRPSFLMVGTIEPRKGYLEAIEAFTRLWDEGCDINLIIVGKEGWIGLPDNMRRDIPKTVNYLRNHRELNTHLFWLDGISDEYLEKVYANSTCLIAASYDEGFGLPLIEAAQHNLPVIARDISVFREVAGANAFYFDGKSSAGFAESINTWIDLYRKGLHPKTDSMSWLSWSESAGELLRVLELQGN